MSDVVLTCQAGAGVQLIMKNAMVIYHMGKDVTATVLRQVNAWRSSQTTKTTSCPARVDIKHLSQLQRFPESRYRCLRLRIIPHSPVRRKS